MRPYIPGLVSSDMTSDDWLTVAECAAVLSLHGVKSMTFVRDEIKAGRLPALIRERASGRTWYRVSRSDLDVYIARNWRYTGGLKQRA